MATVNARQIIIEETVAIARDAAADWHNAQATIDEAKEIQAGANERYQGCHATATLFKFDLEEEVARAIAREHAAAPNTVADDFRGVILPPVDARPTIRDFALAEAERAYPAPVRAATLRQAYKERFGKEVHSKSFGMTLYRLSEDHFVERRGQSDWFFVDEAERKVRRERDQAEILDGLFNSRP